ncbi:MAG: VOC family protein [Bryobacteraceae bacterium]|nr:VOC family protein [Bryobacteraceae bacterium]
MAIRRINPYVNVDGTAEKAIRRYEEVLGAKTEQLMRWGEMPGMEVKPEHRDRVMHACLNVGGQSLMISDSCPERGAPQPGNVQINLQFSDAAELEKAFAALAEGGRVEMPAQETFWAKRFGMLTDAYGVQWMMNCIEEQP